MRTIKFRGRDFAGTWWKGDLLHDGDNTLISPMPGMKVYVEPTTVGQFTGLQDRDGKDIYEGDIIITDFDTDDIIVVRFVRGVFAFLWNDDLDNELPTNAPTQEWAIVVGNIHDNPELLKGGE